MTRVVVDCPRRWRAIPRHPRFARTMRSPERLWGDALVTGDRDLLGLEDVGVAVIRPREPVERLADAP